MSKKIISTTKAPPAVGTYSQGVEYRGVFYFSGLIGLCPQTHQLQESFSAQLHQILENLDGLLESQNLNREKIIKTTLFLTDLRCFEEVNQAYKKYFQGPFPARSCVEVSALPKGAQVEIEVIAGH